MGTSFHQSLSAGVLIATLLVAGLLPAGSLFLAPRQAEAQVLDSPGVADDRVQVAAEKVAGVTVISGFEVLAVYWTAVPDADGYKVQWKSGSEVYDAGRQNLVDDGATTTTTIMGLASGTVYTVRVIATESGEADADPSEEASGTPGGGKVAGVMAGSGEEELQVSWAAMPGADGYKVQWKSGSEMYDAGRQNVIDDGAVTMSTISGLVAGTSYAVRVIATRDAGADGEPSDEVSGTPTAPAPARAVNLSLEPGPGSLSASWDPADNAESYRVQWKSGTEDYDAAREQRVTGVTTAVISDLMAGTAYTVRVIATRTHAEEARPSAEATGTPAESSIVVGANELFLDESGERNSATYTVGLAEAPSGADGIVLVTLSGFDSNTVSVTPSVLIFSRSDWRSPRTVTVRARDDSVINPAGIRSTVVRHRADGLGERVMEVRILDDDAGPTAMISLSTSSLTLEEAVGGRSGSYTVELARAPTIPVTIRLSNHDPGVVTVRPDFLAFSTTNWDEAQTVEVMAIDDSLDNPADSRRTSIRHTAAGFIAEDLVVTVQDDDLGGTAGLTLSVNALSLDEDGGRATYTVVLDAQPAGLVTVAPSIGGSDGDIMRVAPAMLTFSLADWHIPRTVTVTGVDNDVDGPDKTATITNEVTGAPGYHGLEAAVAVTVRDDEVAPTATLTLAPDSVPENGGVSRVGATLSHASSEVVTLTVAVTPQGSGTTGDFMLGADPAVLTIAAGDTRGADTITITAVNNNDDTDDKSFTVSAVASGPSGVGDPAPVGLTITDDDDAVPSVTLGARAVTVMEDAGTATYTVVLASAPAGEVTVALASKDPGLARVSPVSLGFTTANWNTTQTVTVHGVDNATDHVSDATTMIGHTVSGGGYAGVTIADVAITVTDDDNPPTATLVLAPDSISEPNSASPGIAGVSTVTAMLSHPSSEAVRLRVSAGSGVTISPNADLVIVAGSTVSTGTVTLTAVRDGTVTAGGRMETVSATVSGTSGVSNPADRMLAIAEGEVAARVVLGKDAVTVSEEGGNNTATYTVALGQGHTLDPGQTVSVAITSGDPAVATVAPASVEFDSTSFSQAQTVTVTGKVDAADNPAGHRVTTIRHVPTGEGFSGTVIASGVAVTVTDDDDAGVTLSKRALTLAEDNGTDDYTLALATPPSDDVTIRLVSSDPTVATVSPVSLDFTTANWNTAQMVTVIGVANTVSNPGGSTAMITHTGIGGGYGGVSLASVPVTATDSEAVPTATLTLTPASIAEDARTATVTATLNHASREDVTLTVSAAPGANAAAGDFLQTGSVLTIPAGQTASTGVVTVTSVDNDLASRDKMVAVSATTAGNSGVQNPSAVNLTLTDDEPTPQVTLVMEPASIPENGGVTAISARVDQAFEKPVEMTVTLTPVSPATTSDYTLDDPVLVIQPGETSSEGAARVEAHDNNVDAPNKTLTVGATVRSDPANADATPPDTLTLTIPDDEAVPSATLVLQSSAISEDGGSTSVVAVLDPASSEAVTLTVSAEGDGATLGANADLTFKAGLTRSGGFVLLTAANDEAVGSDRTVTISAVATGGGVSAPPSLTVAVIEDDGATGVKLGRSAVAVHEGQMTDYTVVLAGAPTGDVTFTPTSSDAMIATVSPETLTFTTDNWETPQTVTITAVEDTIDILGGQSETTITHVVDGGGYGDVAVPNFVVTILDNDPTPDRGVSTSERTVSIEEAGGTASYTVALDAPPDGGVIVSLGTLDERIATVRPSRLRFGTENWNVPQTVTVTGMDDSLANPGGERTTQVGHVATGGGYDSITIAPVAVTVTDDEEPARVLLGLSSASISEDGGESVVTAYLDRAASEDVIVTVGVSAIPPATDSVFTLVGNAVLDIPAGQTASTVSVTITPTANNLIDAPDAMATVSGTVTSGPAGAPASRTLTITDDDDPPTFAFQFQGVTPSDTPQMPEQGGTIEAVAVLNGGVSGAPTTVKVLPVAGAYAVGSPGTVTIPAGVNESAERITISAVDDSIDNVENRQVNLVATVMNAYGVIDGNAADPAAIVLEDNETTPTATLSLAPSVISEIGGVSAVRATLSHPSSETVTLGVKATGATVSLSPGAELTIPAGQTTSTGAITITARGNNRVLPPETVTVSATVTGNSGVSNPADRMLSIIEGETPGGAQGVAVSANLVTVTEAEGAGNTATYTVVLTLAPTGDVTITPSSDDPMAATVAPASLTFTTGNWNATQTVTVTGVSDAIANPGGERVAVISHAVSGPGYSGGVTAPGVAVAVTDDEDARLSLNKSAVSIEENGGTDTYTVALASQPTGVVTVSVSSDDPAVATVAPASLTFNAGNWETAQTVTVTGVDTDVDEPDNRTVAISHRATGGGYDGATPARVAVTVTDDEATPTATLALTPATISEVGALSTVTASLDHASMEVVTLTVSAAPVAHATHGDFALGANAELVIPAGATESTGLVTILSYDNAVYAPDKEITVSATVSGPSGVAKPADQTLTLADNEAPTSGVEVSETALTVTEAMGDGRTGTYTVELARQPAANVAVRVVSTDSSAASVEPTSLVFAPSNWDTPQTVTVTAVDDSARNAGGAREVTILHSGSGAGFSGADIGRVAVTVTDDDAPGVVLSEAGVTVAEMNGTATYTVELDRVPTGTVTLSLSSEDPGVAQATPASLTFTVANWNTAQTVTVSGVNDNFDNPNDRTTRITHRVGGGGYDESTVADVVVTATDDEATPVAMLVITSMAIAENGGSTAVLATLDRASSEPTVLTVSAAGVAPATGDDFELSANRTLSIAAGQTTSTGIVTIAAVDNEIHAANKTVTVSAAASGASGIGDPDSLPLTLTEDDPRPIPPPPPPPVVEPTVTLALTTPTINESGAMNAATVTASRDRATSEAVTVRVAVTGTSVTLGANAELTIAADATGSTGTVTITAIDDEIDAPDRIVSVEGAVTSGMAIAPASLILTIVDDEETPTVSLNVADAAIAEGDGKSSVSATISPASSADTTVTVTPVAGSYTIEGGATITIAAGATASANDPASMVTIVAVDDSLDNVNNRRVEVTGRATNPHGVIATVTPAGLTLVDDDSVPMATLEVSPPEISEMGGVAIATAQLTHGSSEEVRLRLSVDVPGGVMLSQNGILTIAAGATVGEVTFTAVDNDTSDGHRTLEVTATIEGMSGIADPPRGPGGILFNIVDDDLPHGVTPSERTVTVTEATGAGNTATYEVVLNSQPSADVRIDPKTGDAAVATVAPPRLTFTAANWNEAQTVTVTGVSDDIHNRGDRRVTSIRHEMDSGDQTYEFALVPDVGVVVTDDDEIGVTLGKSAVTVTEDGGTDTYTVVLASPPVDDVTISVSSSDPDVARVAPASLTFTDANWSDTQTITVTGVGNDVDNPNDATATISHVASGRDYGLVSIPGVAVTATDDEDTPTATLALDPDSIGEDAETSVVTASLDAASAETVTLTVSVTPTSPATSGDYTLSDDVTLTIAPGQTESVGRVTVTSVDNDEDAPDKTVSVTAAVSGSSGVQNPAAATLTIADDEETPTTPVVSLSLSPASINESGGTTASSVTATLSRAAQAPVSVTVSVTDSSVTLGANRVLTFAAGQTDSTGTVTLTAVNNDVDAPNQAVAVSGTVSSGTAMAPEDVTLTVVDDEAAPTVTLALGSATIAENGGTTRVRATMNHASSQATTVLVAPNPSIYTLGVATALTIPAGMTQSSGIGVLITAIDDRIDNFIDRSGEVTGSAANGQGVVATATPVTLTLTDNESPPVVALVLTPESITEDGGVSTVTATLSAVSPVEVTLMVSAAPGPNTAAGDFSLAGSMLTIATGQTRSTGAVTITAEDNDRYEPGRTVTVSATVSSTGGIAPPASRTLAILDDEGPPMVTLALDPVSIDENGGVSTVTATLNRSTTTAVEVAVLASGEGFTLSEVRTLMIEAGQTTSTGTVTITAVDDNTDGPDKTVTVSGEVTAGGLAKPADVTLTITDDDGLPTVTLVLTPETVPEAETATVTATLSGPSSEAVELTVSAAAGAGTTTEDFTLQGSTLSIAAGETESTGEVTIVPTDNTLDEDDRVVTLSAVASGGNGVAAPANVILTITDDDASPQVTLTLMPTVILPDGGVSTVTASLSNPTIADVTVTVVVTPTGDATTEDFVLSANAELVIPARTTESTGVVTITGVENPDREPAVLEIAVSATAASTRTVTDPEDVLLRIVDGLPPERRQKGIERTAGEVLGIMGWQTNAILGDRVFGADRSDPAIGFANYPAMDPDDPEDAVTRLTDFLDSGTELSLVLAPPSTGLAGAPFAHDGEGLLRVWAKGSSVSTEFDRLERRTQEGSVQTVHLGADSTYESGLVIGFALGWHSSSIDFEDRLGGPDILASGTIDTEMWSASPYIALVRGSGRYWASVGVGRGTYGYVDSPGGVAPTEGRTTSSDLEMLSIRGGTAHEFGEFGQFDLVGRGDGMFSQAMVNGSRHPLVGYDEFTATNYGARGQLEVGMTSRFDDVRIRPFGVLGGRWDGGASQVGASLEFGGGVTLESSSFFADAEIWNRRSQADNFTATGYSLSLGYDQAGDNRGPQLELEHSAGPVSFDPFGGEPHSAAIPEIGDRKAGVRVGYGIGIRENLFMPYSEADWTGTELSSLGGGLDYTTPTASYGLGYRLEPAASRTDGRDDHSVRADIRISLGE